MQDHTGSVAEVIRVLYREMESIVTAYDPIRGPINIMEARKNIRKEGPVNGTSTFPAGIGLWRTEEPFGKAPEHFPRSPIMILGHNWGAVHELEDSYEHGCDYPLDGRTWKYLRLYLKAAKVCKTDCFFTNALVGLQPCHAIGRMKASREFTKQCRAFLCKQIEIVKPRLVVILGGAAEDQYRRSKCATQSVKVFHPSYVCRHFREGMRDRQVEEQAAKIRRSLDDLIES